MENDSASLHRLIKEKLQHGSQNFVIKEELKAFFRVLACKDSSVSMVPYSNVYGHTMQMWQKWAGMV